MSNVVLVGQGDQITKIPREEWEHGLSHVPHYFESKLSFMSEEHHLVRYFVVRELPIVGEPLSPELIAQELDLSVVKVNAILQDLETHMTFLFRNEQGAVAWAYPVTVDITPHHITFSSGERLDAA